MYLLDTNHCSRLMEGDESVVQRAAEAGDDQLATSLIVRGELIFMAERSDRREANLRRVHTFLEDVRLYLLDEPVSEVYGDLKAALFRRYGPIERAAREA